MLDKSDVFRVIVIIDVGPFSLIIFGSNKKEREKVRRSEKRKGTKKNGQKKGIEGKRRTRKKRRRKKEDVSNCRQEKHKTKRVKKIRRERKK